MVKYVAVQILSLALFGTIANSQMNRPQAQTPSLFSTERVPSTDPRSPQQQAARLMQRQAQLRTDTTKLVVLIIRTQAAGGTDQCQYSLAGCGQEGERDSKAGQERARQDEERLLTGLVWLGRPRPRRRQQIPG
jgi:hypothetical protein